MAQLRQDFTEFEKRNTVILVVGPEDSEAFFRYFNKNSLPFTGLPDPTQKVLKTYGQEIKLLKFGRMPAQLLVDQTGTVRFAHYGQDMADIPQNSEMLGLIDGLNRLQPS
jgi:peroxiredoxin